MAYSSTSHEEQLYNALRDAQLLKIDAEYKKGMTRITIYNTTREATQLLEKYGYVYKGRVEHTNNAVYDAAPIRTTKALSAAEMNDLVEDCANCLACIFGSMCLCMVFCCGNALQWT